jgi:predicted nucleic acid-binding protein
MLLPDVNVLVYAHREDSTADHPQYAAWLTDLATRKEPFSRTIGSVSRVSPFAIDAPLILGLPPGSSRLRRL